MFKKLSAVVLILATTGAWAQSYLTVDSLAKGDQTKAAFAQMVKGHKLPKWVVKGGTTTPAKEVTLGGDKYQVLEACKPHNCGAERIAILYSEQQNTMAGVYSTVKEQSGAERLVWMNAGDKLSIDGKTVLFAALTGSLENHPDAFNYK